MPGFVDVTSWTAEEVRRLGHADDYDDVDHRPRRKFAPRVQPASVRYSVSDVWAAACAADRVNGGYFKEYVYEHLEGQPLSQPPAIVKRKNRDIMFEFLSNPDRLTVDDVVRGEQCRNFLQNDLTFRTLKNKTTDFDNAVRKVLAVSEHFDSYQNKYELAIVACLPASVVRSEQRQNSDQRMKFATGGLIGQVGQKAALNIEVVSANYSQQYNIFWIRGITDQDQPVMFSSREKFDAGSHLTVQGKVKAHRDNLTQLNYVKVL